MENVFENLVELLDHSRERFADRPLFGTKPGADWHWTTYQEFHDLVARCRGGLAELGIGAGDRVAIIADNSLEWAAACFACYGLQAAFVPMYRAQSPREWCFILSDCEAVAVLVSDEEARRQIEAARRDLPALNHVIALYDSDELSFAELVQAAPVDARLPGPETAANLIYTSGTTGNPKGVILSHGNFASNVSATMSVFPIEAQDRSLAFLPWAHAYGQAAELYMLMSAGASTAINDSLANLPQNLGEVRPTIFVGVPRIFNKIYDSVNARVSRKSPVIRTLFHDALDGAKRRSAGKSMSSVRKLELAVADRLIFSKVRARFGGRLRFVISAAAALNREVADFFDAVGITVYEGYGLTETSPVVAINRPGARRAGSVGRVIPGVRVEIDRSASDAPDSGEIIVYGSNVMQGYHHRPDDNRQAFTDDGGFRTGDLGYFDEDGFLHVSGRIKEQYKLENGKYVMPTPVEETLQLSPFIVSAMLHGANRPYNVALFAIDRDAVEAWANREGLQLGELTTDPRVHELIAAQLDEVSSQLRGYELPRRWILTTDELTAANGMLTPTLKLKRRNVLARYGDDLEALYSEERRPDTAGLWPPPAPPA